MDSVQGSASSVVPTASARVRLRPLDPAGVRLLGGLLGDRQRVNREVTIPHGAEQLERAGTLENLRVAAGRSQGGHRGMVFSDSDVYKWLEALAWETHATALTRARAPRGRDDGAGRCRPAGRRLPEQLLAARRPRALERPRDGARALLRGALDPGGGRRGPDGLATPPRRRTACRRPARRRLRLRLGSPDGRPPRDRGRARRAVPRDRGSPLSRPRGQAHRPPRLRLLRRRAFRAFPTTRTSSPFAAPARSSAMRCARSISPPG